jgi:hypothetical protein
MTVLKLCKKIPQSDVESQTPSCNALFKSDTITDNCHQNVISITAAGKTILGHKHAIIHDEKFNYPMLECS